MTQMNCSESCLVIPTSKQRNWIEWSCAPPEGTRDTPKWSTGRNTSTWWTSCLCSLQEAIFIQLVVGNSLLDAGCRGPSAKPQRQAGSEFVWLWKPTQWSGFGCISTACSCTSNPKAKLETKVGHCNEGWTSVLLGRRWHSKRSVIGADLWSCLPLVL